MAFVVNLVIIKVLILDHLAAKPLQNIPGRLGFKHNSQKKTVFHFILFGQAWFPRRNSSFRAFAK